MEGFEPQAAARVPLAEATFEMLAYLTDAEFLRQVFERHRGRSFELTLSFQTMVQLIGDALLEHSGSGRRALLQARDHQELPVTSGAFYAKLRRLPQQLSQGFLAEAAQRLRNMFVAPPSPLPTSLQAFDVLAIDGKKIKHAAKRLKPTRTFRGSVLGGKVLVALSLQSGLAVALNSDLDGEVNDPPLVPGLLEQVRAAGTQQPRLFVLDRQFCDLQLPQLLTAEGDHFLIRYHQKVSFLRDETHPVQTGVDARGRTFTDERGWLGRPQHKQRRYVRRVTLQRPGEEEVGIITDLLDEQQFPPADLLETYAQRWGIERVFQQITEVFHLRQLIASSPQGTIFQCAFCLVLYNLLQVQRSHVAQSRTISVEEISLENLFYDVRRQLTAWNEMIPREWTIERFSRPRSLHELLERLSHLFSSIWKDSWLKALKKKHRPRHLRPPTAGGHTSIQRLLNKPPDN